MRKVLGYILLSPIPIGFIGCPLYEIFVLKNYTPAILVLLSVIFTAMIATGCYLIDD